MAPARDDLFHVHRPAMVSEVLRHLFDDARAAGDRLVVDGTVGPGGHTEAILASDPEVRVLGLDRDPEVLPLAEARLRADADRVRLRHASYAALETVLAAEAEWVGGSAPWGVLLDLGGSSLQFDDPERGFSFQAASVSGDMRFDRTSGDPTALEWVNRVSERDLADVLHELGEEPRARAVARSLVGARPIRDGAHLAEVVRRAAWRTRRHDPATRSFQAIRIAVNDEFGHLERGLEAALASVRPGGRLVVISFHSGEDRRVKHAFQRAAREGRGRVRTRKPERPTDEEVRKNRRARPARLRAIEVAASEREDGTER